ncbi:hypothetical protein [Rubellimicrobium arenae]|uniref:hypothetical protein n=1 Tax=Rubellimicrobium arenae TaxID=2817372 RepID=UPI001B30263A|nr:hypothetical protein [Rubellimicrobium arenae]
MSLLLNLILGVAFTGAVGGVFHYWRLQLETVRRDGLQALAARRGWALTVTGERLGRAGTLRLVPRGGHPWITEVRPKDGRLKGPVTEFDSAEPRWSEGVLILIAAEPDLPSPLDGSPEGDPGLAARQRERALRDLLGEEVARQAAKLERHEGVAGVTALVDGNLARRIDLHDLSRALSQWIPVASGARGQPILILTPEGMRLRLRYPIRRPDQMERFVDLALDLARLIGP